MKENKQRDRKIEELCAKFFILFCFGYMLTNTFVIKLLLGLYFAGMSVNHFESPFISFETLEVWDDFLWPWNNWRFFAAIDLDVN